MKLYIIAVLPVFPINLRSLIKAFTLEHSIILKKLNYSFQSVILQNQITAILFNKVLLSVTNLKNLNTCRFSSLEILSVIDSGHQKPPAFF